MANYIHVIRGDEEEDLVLNLEDISIVERFHPQAEGKELGPVAGTLITMNSGTQLVVANKFEDIARIISVRFGTIDVEWTPSWEEKKEKKKNGKSRKTSN